ncbi:hypothetical protein ACF3DV_12320 [Chlorogloeopsis fritschii PCC 9212]|nr:hypothetical protein [Chlorogloeopsis fritschii]
MPSNAEEYPQKPPLMSIDGRAIATVRMVEIQAIFVGWALSTT